MQWSTFMLIFRSTCILLTTAMIAYWVHNYSLNADTSLVEFRNFFGTEDDVYPELSVCFKNPFLKERLIAEYGINESLYLGFLQGSYISTKMLEIDYENVTLDFENYKMKYFIRWKNNSYTFFPSGKFKSSVSFNGFWYDNFYKCFAIHTPQDKNMLYVAILVKNEIFPNGVRPSIYDFMTFFHYSNQFLRSIPTVKYEWTARSNNSTYGMNYRITGMEILNRRNKGSDPCSPGWETYDANIVEQHINKIGCRTPYQNVVAPLCNSSHKMKEAQFHLSLEAISKYSPPCRALEKLYYDYGEVEYDGSAWEGKGTFWIEIFLFGLGSKFKEIVQSRYVPYVCYHLSMPLYFMILNICYMSHNFSQFQLLSGPLMLSSWLVILVVMWAFFLAIAFFNFQTLHGMFGQKFFQSIVKILKRKSRKTTH